MGQLFVNPFYIRCVFLILIIRGGLKIVNILKFLSGKVSFVLVVVWGGFTEIVVLKNSNEVIDPFPVLHTVQFPILEELFQNTVK